MLMLVSKEISANLQGLRIPNRNTENEETHYWELTRKAMLPQLHINAGEKLDVQDLTLALTFFIGGREARQATLAALFCNPRFYVKRNKVYSRCSPETGILQNL